MITAAKIGIGVYWIATIIYLALPLPLPEFLPRWSLAAMAGFIMFLHVLEFLWFKARHPGHARPIDFAMTLIFGFTHLLPRHQELTRADS